MYSGCHNSGVQQAPLKNVVEKKYRDIPIALTENGLGWVWL